MRLRGLGMGIGMALGTAVLVQRRGGVAVPPRIAESIARRRSGEKPDVVLVAEEYATAAALADALPWANVVGIAAANAAPGSPLSHLSAVVNVPNLLESVESDVLILIDAERGVVLADPDPVALAQYQAEAENLAPKRRLYLGEAHRPAQTLDGRVLSVAARVQTLEDVEHAVEDGADLLHVPFNALLLPADTDDETTRHNLNALLVAAAGKPLLISDEYALPVPLLLEAAARAEIILAVPPLDHLDGLGLGELAFDLNEGLADALERGDRVAAPRLAAELDLATVGGDPEQAALLVEKLAARGATRLAVRVDYAGPGADVWARLDALAAAAAANTLPALLPIPDADDDTDRLPLLVGTGATGLETNAEDVAELKGRIRELSGSESRSALTAFLNEGGGA